MLLNSLLLDIYLASDINNCTLRQLEDSFFLVCCCHYWYTNHFHENLIERGHLIMEIFILYDLINTISYFHGRSIKGKAGTMFMISYN